MGKEGFPSVPRDLVDYNAGNNYANDRYQRLLEPLKMNAKMSRQDNRVDNATMKTFYGRGKISSARDYVFADESPAGPTSSTILKSSTIFSGSISA